LPRLDEADTGPFWRATAEHRLTFQVCDSCEHVVFYPRRHCPSCGGLETAWHDSVGYGTLYTFTIVRQHGMPFFAERVPYVVGVIDLDEGFRITSEIITDDLDAVAIGSRLRVRWEDHTDLAVPLFALEQP
jgi:uncharacterized OB-fold protein